MNKYIVFKIVIVILLTMIVYNEDKIKSKLTSYYNYLFPIPMTELDRKLLKKGQERMTNMFRHFDRICRKYNLKYWLNGGTLIGAIRHKGWIPLDGDIDLCMTDVDFKVLEEVAEMELPKDMWIQTVNSDKHYNKGSKYLNKIRDLEYSYIDWPSSHHNGLQVDIFVFEQSGDTLLIPSIGHDIFTMKMNDVFPLKELEFEGISVYVQNNYVDYMNKIWGGCPPKELAKRIEYPMPHEGRIRKTPDVIKQKYCHLYNLC